jgi:hypothetical protein
MAVAGMDGVARSGTQASGLAIALFKVDEQLRGHERQHRLAQGREDVDGMAAVGAGQGLVAGVGGITAQSPGPIVWVSPEMVKVSSPLMQIVIWSSQWRCCGAGAPSSNHTKLAITSLAAMGRNLRPG